MKGKEALLFLQNAVETLEAISYHPRLPEAYEVLAYAEKTIEGQPKKFRMAGGRPGKLDGPGNGPWPWGTVP